ncbi:MAG: radical SAM family heme chaperone HemW [Bacteroidales bacterium]|nr:radical SAM family heme chaperone HemW [Bacteroidales bacterium]
MNKLSLYIHVPFCQKRCHYCSFYSTTFGKAERDLYVQALLREMETRAEMWHQQHPNKDTAPADRPEVQTVYFGGGTPSQLDEEELSLIFTAIRHHFNIANEAEITFECNPDDLDSTDLATTLKRFGVNRISMGVQSFDDEMLRSINRRHSAAQVFNAIRSVHKAGIHNVSIDLIYGLPNQTLEDWKKDVNRAVSLAQESHGPYPAVTHISSYCLSIEPGTHLYNMHARGEIKEVDEQTTLEMYSYLINALEAAGFLHYEISNFALPGYHSCHNTAYWTGVPYIGLGPAAHSYDGLATRRWNSSDLKAYCANQPYEEEHLTPSELYDELVMTRLRTRDGLPLSLLTEAQRRYILREARRYVETGHLCVDEKIRLTRKGIFISDTIFADLMSAE